MGKYRILEVEGKYQKPDYYCPNKTGCDNLTCKQDHVYQALIGKTINSKGEYYIPKFIVQERSSMTCEGADTRYFNNRGINTLPSGLQYKWLDLKEFSSLEEARNYKYQLELRNGGIVHE